MSALQLSVIIPVCNVEKYIGACLESIYRQGIPDDSFEVIVVNDGSTDQTMEIVACIECSHHNIIIINQVNAGPSVSRNAGMERASGQYVLFVDSDDLLMDNGLLPLLQKAEASSVDMVVADFMRVKDEEISDHYESYMTDSHIIEKSGFDYYVDEYRPGEGSFIWRILYKRSFLNTNHLRLIPGVYYEDISFLQQCYLKAERVIGVHLLYYIYRIRQRSCTYSFTMRNAMDYNTAIEKSWELLKMDSLTERVRRQIQDNVFLFFNYAVDCIICVFSRPEERKTIVSDLRKKVPDLQFKGSLRKHVISWLFLSMPYTYIRWRLFSKRVNNWYQARIKTSSLALV